MLGILIAASFGSGDYVGGRASSASSTIAVVFVSQAFALVGAGVLAVTISAEVATHDIVYGVLAGTVNVVGLALLYHGLARYAAGVVAPICAVTASLVPVGWGLSHGERPPGLVLAGIAFAIGAVALIAHESGPSIRRGIAAGAVQGGAAGLALGSSLVLYAETSTTSGQFPVFAARCASFALAAIGVWWLRRNAKVLFPHGSVRALALGAGALDITATALLVVAVRHDLLSVVAPVVSLAPAFTVVLAWRLGGEHLNLTQRIGLVVALTGLVLIAAG